MAELINRFEIHNNLLKMMENADRQLILISPYIKLHDEYKAALLKKIHKHDLAITVVFGKNKDEKSKSLSVYDVDFFKQFPNISIKYCERLHAKIYANDYNSLLTSMNLHMFSAGHNIEAGILCKFSFIGDLLNRSGSLVGLNSDSLDDQIYSFADEIVHKYSTTVFERKPIYDKGFLSKTYVGSEILLDCDQNYRVIKNQGGPILDPGYCIRTGVKIPYDLKKPYSIEAYKSWSRYNNPDYKEKYCHYSGEVSHGDTTMKKPVLKKNWRMASHDLLD